MCTGLELPLLLGAGVSAAGSIAGGMGRASDARLKADVAGMNANVGEATAQTNTLLAELPAISARLEETKLRDAIRATLGSEVAAYSAANIDPSSGAPLLVAGVTAAQGQVDIGLTRAKGALDRAAGLAGAASSYAESASSRFQVAAADQEGRNAMTSAIYGAGTSFLSAFSSGGFGFGGGSSAIVAGSGSLY